MSKQLSFVPSRPALPRVVAVPAQVRPLVRGLKKATKRTIEESAEITVRRSARETGQSLWKYVGIGFGVGFGVGFGATIISDVYKRYKQYRLSSEARSAEPTVSARRVHSTP